LSPSFAPGVGHPASCAAIGRIKPKPLPFWCFAFIASRRASQAVPVFPLSIVLGVGHPPQTLPDVRSADARSAQIDRPCGVARSFQISAYTVEPGETCSACHLLANDDRRPDGCDQAVHLGPEVPFIFGPCSLAGVAEGLARAGASPEGSVVGPASKSSCMAPPAETREEVDLGKPSEVFGSDIYDAPFIHDAIGNVAGGDQVTQPGGGVGVDFVVVCGHGFLRS
jgi:hypothetical protein